jgi:hypothetical protein
MTDDKSQMTDGRIAPADFRRSPTETDLRGPKLSRFVKMKAATGSKFVICHWSFVI